MDRALRRRGGGPPAAPLTSIAVEAACGLPRAPWRGTAALVFRRCAYFSDGRDAMLAVGGRSAGAAPAGFRLGTEAPAHDLGLREGSTLAFDGAIWTLDGRLLLPGGAEEPATWAPQPRLVPRVSLAAQLAALAPGSGADAEWTRLLRTAEALARTSPLGPATAGLSWALLGWGSGSTPAGDDFLTGWLAGLARQRQGDLPAHRALAASLSATCRLSRHFLGHALAGRFHGALVRLAGSPGLPAPDGPAARALSALGHRSGRSALAGFYAGLHQGA